MAAAAPAITIWFGELMFAALQTSPCGSFSASRGHRLNIGAQNRGHGAGADGHRLLHVLAALAHRATASVNDNAPAATSAEYSPRL